MFTADINHFLARLRALPAQAWCFRYCPIAALRTREDCYCPITAVWAHEHPTERSQASDSGINDRFQYMWGQLGYTDVADAQDIVGAADGVKGSPLHTELRRALIEAVGNPPEPKTVLYLAHAAALRGE